MNLIIQTFISIILVILLIVSIDWYEAWRDCKGMGGELVEYHVSGTLCDLNKGE